MCKGVVQNITLSISLMWLYIRIKLKTQMCQSCEKENFSNMRIKGLSVYFHSGESWDLFQEEPTQEVRWQHHLHQFHSQTGTETRKETPGVEKKGKRLIYSVHQNVFGLHHHRVTCCTSFSNI